MLLSDTLCLIYSFDYNTSLPLESKLYEDKDFDLFMAVSSAPVVVPGAYEVLKNICEWVNEWTKNVNIQALLSSQLDLF